MTCNSNCNQGRQCDCKAIHVVPLNDWREHELSKACWCRPVKDQEEDIWIHNAMDGREAFETGELNCGHRLSAICRLDRSLGVRSY
jgi:hypothetical protein